jgi:hypothetical protein
MRPMRVGVPRESLETPNLHLWGHALIVEVCNEDGGYSLGSFGKPFASCGQVRTTFYALALNIQPKVGEPSKAGLRVQWPYGIIRSGLTGGYDPQLGCTSRTSHTPSTPNGSVP